MLGGRLAHSSTEVAGDAELNRNLTLAEFVDQIGVLRGSQAMANPLGMQVKRSPDGFRRTGLAGRAGPLEPGKEYDFKIIKISPETRRIGLSYRAAVKQVERREIEQYKSTSKSSSTATIGDAIQSKLSAR